MSQPPLLEVLHVTKVFKLGGLVFGSKLTAVDDVSLEISQKENKILTLAGESGSGKTTLSRIILGLLKPTKGKVIYKGMDVFKLKKKEAMLFRREVQPVFQNPYESFNPLRKVYSYLVETTMSYGLAKNREEAESVADGSLEHVGLNPHEIKGRYPHELSGGQLQRVAIARALITRPRLLVADEPVSMVDASLRMGILNLFLELKNTFNMSIIYITHDLATAYYISDEIAIMYRGSILEYGSVDKVLTDPLHPYTRVLIESIPEPDPTKRWSREVKLSGIEIKEFEALGCKFADRCPYAMEKCSKHRPPQVDVEDRKVRCWLYCE